MVELAGFDVILQIARASLAEIVNYFPITFANQAIYLLGGPFSVDLPLDSIYNYINA
jgi:hypothetical protein